MDLFFGLPLHPLAVHLPVVLLPLGALLVIVLTFVPRLRRHLALPTLALLTIGTGGAFLAKESGEQLARRLGGVPEIHEQLGSALAFLSLGLLVIGGVWLWLVRRPESPRRTVLGVIASIVSVAVLGVTVAVGHTGAQAVWADVVNPAPAATSSAESSNQASTHPQATATQPTMADAQQHDQATDCWAAIDGKVYDLTPWVDQHPGGPEAIKGLCGTDATKAFTAQHGGQREPEQELQRFLVGSLAG